MNSAVRPLLWSEERPPNENMKPDAIKVCCSCSRKLPPERFVKDRRKKHGVGYRCKECEAARHAKYNAKPRVKKMQALRQRNRYWADREKSAKRRSTFRRAHEQGMKFERSPEKERARRVLENAVRSGKIAKPLNCQECGAGGLIHGHHEDYNKPLSVDWLCPPCHGKRHRKYREDALLAAFPSKGEGEGE